MQETYHGDVSTSAAGKDLEISSSVPHDDKLEDKRRQRMDEKSRSVEPALRQRLSKSDQIDQELGILGRHSTYILPNPESLTASCYDVEIHRIE